MEPPRHAFARVRWRTLPSPHRDMALLQFAFYLIVGGQFDPRLTNRILGGHISDIGNDAEVTPATVTAIVSGFAPGIDANTEIVG